MYAQKWLPRSTEGIKESLTAHEHYLKGTCGSSTIYVVDRHRRLFLQFAKSLERGSNENANGLLRQYFPRETDLSVYSQTHLNKVAPQLNERPQDLGIRNPAETFSAWLRRPVEPAALKKTATPARPAVSENSDSRWP